MINLYQSDQWYDVNNIWINYIFTNYAVKYQIKQTLEEITIIINLPKQINRDKMYLQNHIIYVVNFKVR